MFSPNRLLAAGLLAAIAGVLLLPMWGLAGTIATDEAPVAERPAAPPSGRFQVRCWQHGRLLFEERDVDLAGETLAGLKLRATDRQRQPVLVTDTGNATCLIRSSPPPYRK